MGFAQDVEQVIVSETEVGRWGNWKKVLQGECHGCFVTNLYADEPLHAGLKHIPIEPYGILGNVTLTISEQLIERRREEVQHLVDAAFDANDLFKKDNTRALEIMRKEPMQLMNIKDEETMRRVYEILKEELSDDPIPSAQGIANTHRIRLSRSPELADFNPLLMWDLSFAKDALKRKRTRT